jgi:hypothetical protein
MAQTQTISWTEGLTGALEQHRNVLVDFTAAPM